MNDYDYFRMLIIGMQQHNQHLRSYLIREQKKAAKEYIEFDEFIDRTIKIIEVIENQIRNQYNKSKLVNQKEHFSLWSFKVDLKDLTNFQFNGEIGYQDTSILRQTLNEAFEFCQLEDGTYELSENKKAHNYSSDKVLINVDASITSNYSHIFFENGYTIWKLLFASFEIVESKRTDLRFIYEIMKYHGMIYSTVTIKNFTDWVNETYGFSIEKLPFTNIKSKSNSKRMLAFNLLRQTS